MKKCNLDMNRNEQVLYYKLQHSGKDIYLQSQLRTLICLNQHEFLPLNLGLSSALEIQTKVLDAMAEALAE